MAVNKIETFRMKATMRDKVTRFTVSTLDGPHDALRKGEEMARRFLKHDLSFMDTTPIEVRILLEGEE